MSSKMAVNKKILVRFKEEDFTLQNFKDAKRSETRKRYKISYDKRGGICYQIHLRKNEGEKFESRFWFPSC